MGIMAFEPLPPNTLVAKAVIPSSYVDPLKTDPMPWDLPADKGILASLRGTGGPG